MIPFQLQTDFSLTLTSRYLIKICKVQSNLSIITTSLSDCVVCVQKYEQKFKDLFSNLIQNHVGVGKVYKMRNKGGNLHHKDTS